MRIFLVVFLLYSSALSAQVSFPFTAASPGTGIPFIRNYSPKEYGAHNQNWAVVQDQRGIMYFGNNHGILEYDGVSWRIIQINDKAIVRSLAIDSLGRIYAGSFAEIGYLAPDSNHQLQFVSLLDHVDEQHRDFSDVWQTLATDEGIYFVTSKSIFRWNGKEMRVWKAKTSFHVGFELDMKFYVRQQKMGLMKMESDSLVMLPLGEKLADEKVMAILPFQLHDKSLILIATRTNGLFLYDGNSIKPFISEADQLLKEAQTYCGAKMPNGQFAFGTLQNGVIVLDSTGRLLHHLNKESGLQGETIWYLYPDRQGGLWAGMHIGISRAETGSPYTYFGEREGLEGSVLEVLKHNDILYAATSMGVYYFIEPDHTNHRKGKFHQVQGVSPQAWALLAFDGTVLAGTFDGVYEISKGQGHLINSSYAMALHRSQRDPNRIYIGLHQGFKSIYFENGKWRDEGKVTGIDQEILRIYETPEGDLWLTPRYDGLIYMDFSNNVPRQLTITRYDTLSGLPLSDRIMAFSTIKGIRFATARGIYSFEKEQRRFLQDTSLIKGLSHTNADLFSITEDRRGNLWMVSNTQSGLATLKGNHYTWNGAPFFRTTGIDIYYAYPDPFRDNITWFGCIDRIIRYDTGYRYKEVPDYTTLIRRVVINGDSVLYGGSDSGPSNMLTIGNGYGSLRFRYATPGFDDESKTTYQYILQGYDHKWSEWSAESYKEYTGLPPGSYTFLVRGKNIYDQRSETASVKFKILPPYYLTPWAFVLYAFLICAFLYAVWQMKLTQVRKKHLHELAQVEFDKLKELDHLKSRFFADISHEFRTPLTLILGPVDKLLSSEPTTDESRQYNMIKRNANRLLHLINQLLDLSKLEAGKMKLELQLEDIVPLINGIGNSFESLVQSKRINLEFKSNIESAFLYFDGNRMEQILTNLISNAVKFTPKGGSVMINVGKSEKNDKLIIEVSDTGPGIEAGQLPHVFDRFYQGNEGSRTVEPGSGIGLALVKELVELHKGSISVKSVEGEGTTFTVQIPFVNADQVHESISIRKNGTKIFTPDEYAVTQEPELIVEEELTSDNTLLLVEDNPDMSSFIYETLKGSYKIITAFDGVDGADKAFEYIPDIIISDVMMPRQDGLQLCEILKHDERTSHIPIILLTAKVDIESRLAGLERGADDYLAKPFHREELLIRTHNLLETRNKLRRYFSSMQPFPEPATHKDILIEDAFLQKIKLVIIKNLSDSELEIDDLSRNIGMSRSQLFRKIKALTGKSPSLFIREIRLNKAKELLETTEMNVSEVAYQVGFSTPAYFSDSFHEVYGVRPSQVKK